jgi:CheY-like chemotaxis protein/MinD-like ATPase involved in chromosome partitioning or flagellar assembly
MAHKILAVDDHPETLSIIVTTLQTHGYNVVSSRSPFRGVQLAEDEQPDLMVVDMQMPDMDGIEVVRQIRKMPQLQDMPIIMFTAVDDAEYKMAGFEAGVDDYITKPTEPMELIHRVQALLESVPDPDPDGRLAATSTMKTMVVDRAKLEFPTPAPPANAPKLIAVLGARGGVGTTTVAINMAYACSETDYATTLIDFDLYQGHISLYLNKKITDGLNELALLPDHLITEQLGDHLMPFSPHLNLLLTKPNLIGRQTIPTAAQTTVILDALMQPNHLVVIDVGRGTDTVTTTILDRADQIILCLCPERVALAAAKRNIEELQEVLFPHTTLNVVMCELNGTISLPQPAVEGYLNHNLAATIPVNAKEMAKAVNKGVSLIQADTQSKISNIFRQLAQQFVKA